MSRPKTIFCDLDGTLTEHPNSGNNDITRYDLEQNMKVLSENRCIYTEKLDKIQENNTDIMHNIKLILNFVILIALPYQ